MFKPTQIALLMLSASGLVLPQVAKAQAVPTKSPACAEGIEIAPVENGSGVFFSEDCKVAFVLPPVFGETKLDQIVGSENLAECQQIANLDATIDNFQNQLLEISKKAAPAVQAPADSSGLPPGAGFDQSSPRIGTPYSATDDAAMKQIIENLTSIKALREQYRGIEGATAHFFYALKMKDVLAAYKAANPKIHFEPLPIQRAYLTYHSIDLTGDKSDTATLSISVPGVGKIPDAPDISTLAGKGKTAAHAAPDSSEKFRDTLIFGQSLSGGMRLSLAGACRLVDPSTGDLPKSLDKEQLTAYLVANVQYAYALQAFRKYHAEYNLGAYAKKLLQNSSHGGFLSTETLTSYVQTTNDDDWFQLKSESDDPRFFYPYLAEEIKANLTDRVLKEITVSSVGGAVDPGGLGTPSANGASVAAPALHKCPSLYCQAAGFVLDIANATFGSSSATNSFISQNNFVSKDDVEEKVMLEYYGSAGFVGQSDN